MDNFQVVGLGLEGQVLGGQVQVLGVGLALIMEVKSLAFALTIKSLALAWKLRSLALALLSSLVSCRRMTADQEQQRL